MNKRRGNKDSKKKKRRGVCECGDWQRRKNKEEGKNVHIVATNCWDISSTITKVGGGNIYYLIFLLLLSFHLFIIIFISIFTLSKVSLTSF